MASVEQTGVQFFSVWIEVAGTAVASTGAPGGIVLLFSDERPRSLTLSWTNNATTTGVLTISMVRIAAPDLFSNSNLPSNATHFQIAQAVSQTYTAGQPSSLALDLTSRVTTDPLDRTNYWLTPTHFLADANSNGRMALVVEFSSGTAISMGSLTLTADTVAENSGYQNLHQIGARAVACPRCGRPALTTELTRDGYTRSMVCPECWDPPDRTNLIRTRRARGIDPR